MTSHDEIIGGILDRLDHCIDPSLKRASAHATMREILVAWEVMVSKDTYNVDYVCALACMAASMAAHFIQANGGWANGKQIVSDKMRENLTGKTSSYTGSANRFYNFEVGGDLLHTSPERALLGYAAKHLAAMANVLWRGDLNPRQSLEWVCDFASYMVLLAAMQISKHQVRARG